MAIWPFPVLIFGVLLMNELREIRFWVYHLWRMAFLQICRFSIVYIMHFFFWEGKGKGKGKTEGNKKNCKGKGKRGGTKGPARHTQTSKLDLRIKLFRLMATLRGCLKHWIDISMLDVRWEWLELPGASIGSLINFSVDAEGIEERGHFQYLFDLRANQWHNVGGKYYEP